VNDHPPGLYVVDHPASGLDGAGPPDAASLVVMVHGSLDRARSFARVVRRLSDLHVVTYDRRGYQRSRELVPLATSLHDHVADLLTVVGGRPAVLIGHSYGGDVALGAALESSGAVRAVGVYEPPMPWMDWWPRRTARDPRAEDPAVFAESFFRRVASDDAWERLPEQGRAERRADGPALVAELTAIRRDRPPFDLTRLEIPVVLGRGGRSLPHHRRAIDALSDLLPFSEVVEFPGAAHGAHLSHPDAFAAFVRRTVARAQRSPGSPRPVPPG
jgi:pimeloyl-ACP methyl ester carboxylesterase